MIAIEDVKGGTCNTFAIGVTGRGREIVEV